MFFLMIISWINPWSFFHSWELGSILENCFYYVPYPRKHQSSYPPDGCLYQHAIEHGIDPEKFSIITEAEKKRWKITRNKIEVRAFLKTVKEELRIISLGLGLVVKLVGFSKESKGEKRRAFRHTEIRHWLQWNRHHTIPIFPYKPTKLDTNKHF